MSDADRITFSISEVCKATGLSESSVRRAIRSGTMPAIRIGSRVLVLAQPLIEQIEAAVGRPDAGTLADRREDQRAADEAERDAEKAAEHARELVAADKAQRDQFSAPPVYV